MKVRPLIGDLRKTAEEELKEVPSKIEEEVNYIKEWLAEQPHLLVRTDDQTILNFLRACGYDRNKTRKRIDLFYTMRKFLPDFFTNRDPFLPVFQDLLSRGIILPLSKKAGNAGPRVVLVRYEAMDPGTPFNLMIKFGLLFIDILIFEDDNSIVCGQQAFIDAKGLSLEYLATLKPREWRNIEKCIELAYPTKPKKIDIVNAPSFFESSYNILKKFLSEKVTNVVSIYDDRYVDTFESIPLDVLPKEYGGQGDTLENLTAYWKKKVESYRDWFLEDIQYGTDESKRPKRPKTAMDVFGAPPPTLKSIYDLF